MMDQRFMREYVKVIESRTGQKWDWDMMAIVKCWPFMNRFSQNYIVTLNPDCSIAVYDDRCCEWTFDHELSLSDITAVYSAFIAQQTLRELHKESV